MGTDIGGHNLLVAGLAAMVISTVAYQWNVLNRIQGWLAKHWKALAVCGQVKTPPHRRSELFLWIVIGVLAAYSHLLIDAMFSVGKNLPIWGVHLLWPFTGTIWAYPLVPWGNIGVTVIFAMSMFAMLRWPAWIRAIAASSLIAVAGYMAICGMCCRSGG